MRTSIPVYGVLCVLLTVATALSAGADADEAATNPRAETLSQTIRSGRDLTAARDAVEQVVALGREGKPAVGALIDRTAVDMPYFANFRGLSFSVDGNPAYALARMGRTAVPKLSERLISDPNPEIRSGCASAFEMMGDDVREAFPALADAMHTEPDVLIRRKAAKVARRACHSRKQREVFVELLDDSDYFVRATAVGAVGDDAELGLFHRDRIRVRLEDADGIVRSAAMGALAKMSKRADITADMMGVVYRRNRGDDEAQEARRALEVLATTGTAGRAALPTIMELIENREQGFLPEAIEALLAIEADASKVRAVLLELMTDGSFGVRRAACDAMRVADLRDEAIEASVCGAMQGTDGSVKIAAAAAFLRAGKHESEAIGALVTALRDPHRSVRFDAVGQLAKLDKGGASVVEALRQATADKDDGVRGYAQWALEQLASPK